MGVINGDIVCENVYLQRNILILRELQREVCLQWQGSCLGESRSKQMEFRVLIVQLLSGN